MVAKDAGADGAKTFHLVSPWQLLDAIGKNEAFHANPTQTKPSTVHMYRYLGDSKNDLGPVQLSIDVDAAVLMTQEERAAKDGDRVKQLCESEMLRDLRDAVSSRASAVIAFHRSHGWKPSYRLYAIDAWFDNASAATAVVKEIDVACRAKPWYAQGVYASTQR